MSQASDQPLNLVRLITWLPVGGIERRLVAVLPRLRDRHGWSPRLICIREEGALAAELKDAGIPVEVVPFPSRLSPPALLRLAAALRRHRPAVLHAHMYRSNLPATISGRLAGVPVIFGQIHNIDSWDNARQRLLDRALCRLRTGTIAVSRAVQLDVMQSLGLPESAVPLLYNGVDIDTFSPNDAAGDQWRAQHGVPRDAVLFLVPARLHPQKNPEGVVAAWRQARAAHPNTPARLVFAGEGRLLEPLRAMVREAGLDGEILLPGRIDAMAPAYNAADAVVLSSFREGFSNAVVEALACGRPVIAADVGGNREAIAPDVSPRRVGWIHDAGDTAALATQMGEALTLGREGLAAHRTACRQRGEQFSIDAMVAQTDQLYRQALARA
jgi:glycosyltransferase involved in cell wall biosynthesis